ncbi:NUDIX domain-containing protein [Micromonospora sp. 4G57]|uniref:NUDIX domain-containing protein n=1 Tax=Micromonospora sicca TaxID=2202420 RepID=A0ABU5JJR1_9ACTN|nr:MULTISPECIES: NUDIX domain-containing protein [unclassified Micromonospora]MDZ5442807.1 NUDIX domain-containing protein [Micromonospora sp. 4G57]MDZ5492644.1 NUDIX domain-containing protein [Micromonospora sp. 4G53]
MSALTWAVAAVVSDDAGRVLLCRQGRGERRWALPGGRLRREESPAAAVLRNIRTETGWDVQIVDLVGLYRLSDRGTAPPPAGRCGPLPDVLVHVFRARVTAGTPSADPTGGCHLGWHAPADLPDAVTPITRTAVTDALAGRSGVLRDAGREPARPATAPSVGESGGGPGATPGAGPGGRGASGDPVAPGQRAEPDDSPAARR